ncbi:MAG: hypothetical protein ACRDRK_18960 [Pseudonocardia sp.]
MSGGTAPIAPRAPVPRCAPRSSACLVDELRVAVAPLLVGDPGAPCIVGPGRFPPGRLRS